MDSRRITTPENTTFQRGNVFLLRESGRYVLSSALAVEFGSPLGRWDTRGNPLLVNEQITAIDVVGFVSFGGGGLARISAKRSFTAAQPLPGEAFPKGSC